MSKQDNEMTIERFECDDGSHHFSVMQGDELATCVMHDTEEQALAELRALTVAA